jgi:hypothetical protein
LSASDNSDCAPFPLTICRKIELPKYFSVVHFLSVRVIKYIRLQGRFTYTVQATVGLGDIGLDAISMLSGQFNVEDPWDLLVDEDTDW